PASSPPVSTLPPPLLTPPPRARPPVAAAAASPPSPTVPRAPPPNDWDTLGSSTVVSAGGRRCRLSRSRRAQGDLRSAICRARRSRRGRVAGNGGLPRMRSRSSWVLRRGRLQVLQGVLKGLPVLLALRGVHKAVLVLLVLLQVQLPKQLRVQKERKVQLVQHQEPTARKEARREHLERNSSCRQVRAAPSRRLRRGRRGRAVRSQCRADQQPDRRFLEL
ncbi:hypothetical protein HDU96_002791, partial [Phlyctochytrium bullatum]